MRKLVMLILAFGLLPSAYGQYRMQQMSEPYEPPPYESDILSARPIRYFIGIGLGGLAFQHNGDFMPDPEVCDCVFSGLDKTQFHYAGEFSIQYPKLGFALKFLMQYYNFSGTFQYEEERMTVIPGDEQDTLLNYQKSSNVDLSYFSITPGFAWYIPKTEGFLLGGINVGIPMESKYDNKEKVLTPGYEYVGEGSGEITYLDKTEIPETPTIRFGLMFALGYDFKLSNRFYLTPQVGATLPLTHVSNEHDTWKVTTEYGLLILKYRL